MSRQPKSSSKEAHPKSLIPQRKPTSINSSSTTKTKYKKSNRRLLSRPAIFALIILILASAAGVAFSIITSIVLHLHTEGDIPSRILVFVASILSIVEGCLYVLVLVQRRRKNTAKKSKSASIRASVLIISRLILVAWIASSVLISLLIAQLAGNGVAVFSLSSPLVDQAIYLDLIISGIALLSSGVFSYYSERSRSPFKGALSTQRSVIDARDTDVESLESIDIHDTIFDGEPVTNTIETVPEMGRRESLFKNVAFSEDELSAEPRQKKLLFSYKSTTQLVDENRMSVGSRQESYDITNTSKALSTPNIKRKPVPNNGRPEAINSIPEPTAVSTFFLSPSIDGGDDFLPRMVPYSPAISRPLSLVPPVPIVPTVPSTNTHPVPTPKANGIKRKPVGTPNSDVLPTRKPIASVYSSTSLLPTIVEPSSEAAPSTDAPVSDPLPTVHRLSAMLSSRQSRKLSTASITSTYSLASPTSPQQSLADMIVSSLRRDSAVSYPTPPPPTNTVTYSQPKIFDQPIIRRSFIATSGGFGLPAGMSTGTSAGNSRRPSAVSIMETIYSPAQEEEAKAQPHIEDEDDADLIEMMKEEAAAAAIFVNAGRYSTGSSFPLAPNNTASTDPVPVSFSPQTMSRKARQARKEVARAVTFPKSPPNIRRSPTRTGHNFSRPMRATGRLSASSRISISFGQTSHTKTTPRSSAILSPRSRVRRQLLQMLPAQYQPKPTAISTHSQTRVSLSGRRHRQSLSIDLVSDSKQGYSSDSGPDSSTSSHASSRILRSSKRPHTRARRSLPLATKARNAHRRQRSRRIAGLQTSNMHSMAFPDKSRNFGMYSPSPQTPHNRPISPMTLLMSRSLRRVL